MATVVMRPTGDVTGEWSPSVGGVGDHWTLVDEASIDVLDYAYTSFNAKTEVFSFATSGLPADSTINSVTGTYLIECPTSGGTLAALLGDGTNGTATAGVITIVLDPGVFRQYSSNTTTLNPATGAAWTLAQVNALRAGIRTTAVADEHKLAQFYVTVDYTAPSLRPPVIRALRTERRAPRRIQPRYRGPGFSSPAPSKASPGDAKIIGPQRFYFFTGG